MTLEGISYQANAGIGTRPESGAGENPYSQLPDDKPEALCISVNRVFHLSRVHIGAPDILAQGRIHSVYSVPFLPGALKKRTAATLIGCGYRAQNYIRIKFFEINTNSAR